MASNPHHITIAEEVSVWIAEGGSIHIKTYEPQGDPVELSEEDAAELAAALTRLLKELRG